VKNKEKIVTGIVLYNPDIFRLRENIAAIYEQVCKIMLVDNASNNKAEIRELINEFTGIELRENSQNFGIAKALNQIFQYAQEKNMKYVLTLDQDSVCPNYLVEEYMKYISADAGIVCPIIRDRNHDLDFEKSSDSVTVVKECITSASLVRIDVWLNVNGFDEDMFIDGVDFDFCERISNKGYCIQRVNSVTLSHEIGHTQIRKFLFWNVRVKNHSASRKYYVARNTIYLAKKRRSKLLYIKSYLQVIKQLILVLLYENYKREKLIAIRKGFFDGVNKSIPEKWC